MRGSLVILTILAVSSSLRPASAQLTNGLARYYELDDAVGSVEALDEASIIDPNLIDSTTNDPSNNLKVNSGSRKSLPSPGATGQIGGAWDFEKDPLTTVGDYDASGGAPNGFDFLVWQQNAGTTNVLPSDPTPGIVDGTDLTNWENNYGQVLNDTPLLDSEGFNLAQFLDEGHRVWDGTVAPNGVFFSMWVKPESLNSGTGDKSRNVIISEDASSQDFWVASTEGGKLEMEMEGVGAVTTSTVQLVVDQWTHVAGGLIVDDGEPFTNTLILYVDGAQAAIDDFASTNTPDSLNDLILGVQDDRADDVDCAADPNDPRCGIYALTAWDGLMDDAAFWRRHLDPNEVADIFARGDAGMGLLDFGPISVSSAVPEPTTLGLAVLGTAMTAVTRRRRRAARRGTAREWQERQDDAPNQSGAPSA